MLRVSAVRYINALPLIYGLDENPDVQLSFDIPSTCFQKLIEGQVDVGLIPIIGTQLNSSIRALKGLGIAANLRSESVLLFARKPLDRLERVLTDRSSLTSVALLKIILREKYNNSPQFISDRIENPYDALRNFDAALIIGDEAILAEKTDFDHYDLATEWHSLTKLPFVFAVWGCARMLTQQEQEILHSAFEKGTANWETVYESAEEAIGASREFLKRYYNDNLHYRLTKADYEGIFEFFSRAAKLEFIPRFRKDIWL